jgi:hypothetical protein
MNSQSLARARVPGAVRYIALGAALCLAALTPAAAQRNPTARPVWPDHYEPNFADAMTATERAAALATLDEIQRILERVPELGAARGFEIGRVRAGGTFSLGESGLMTYGMTLVFYPPSKAATFGEGSGCIGVSVNKANGSHEGIRYPHDEEDREMYIEQDIGDPIPGATIVHEGLRWDTPTADRRPGYVTLTKGGASQWMPVTKEQYLRSMIFNAEGKNGELEKEARKGLETTAYAMWMAEAAARKKQREETIATVSRLQGRAAADEMRKQLEQTEREVTEQMKAQEAEERAQKQDALAHRLVDDLRSQLAAMSPAERATPAAVGMDGKIVTSGVPGSHRVLTPDREFWRVRRSRVEVHSIQVTMGPTQMCENQAVHAAVAKAWETLDWMALKRIVDRP